MKLLITLGILAALLTALGVIGLVVLGQANTRAERLVELQRRTAAYSDLRLATTAQLYSLARAVALPQVLTIDAAARQGTNASPRSSQGVPFWSGAEPVFGCARGLAGHHRPA